MQVDQEMDLRLQAEGALEIYHAEVTGQRAEETGRQPHNFDNRQPQASLCNPVSVLLANKSIDPAKLPFDF